MNEKEIEHLLRSLGIGATYRGYRYLNYGIRLCLIDEDYLLSVSKLLDPQIAKYFHTTSCSVELALRPIRIRPTSSEFLDILTAHLRK